jgi:hypothetical protein
MLKMFPSEGNIYNCISVGRWFIKVELERLSSTINQNIAAILTTRYHIEHDLTPHLEYGLAFSQSRAFALNRPRQSVYPTYVV